MEMRSDILCGFPTQVVDNTCVYIQYVTHGITCTCIHVPCSALVCSRRIHEAGLDLESSSSLPSTGGS